VAAYGLHAAVLSDLDRLADARTALDAAAEAAGARSTRASTVTGAEATLALDSGDLEAAAAALDTCLVPVDDEPPHPSQVAQRAAVALHQQGPRAAERWLRRITADLDPFAPELGMVWLPRVGASIRIARGDLKGAAEELWRGWVWRQSAEAVPDLLRIAPAVVEIADRTGDKRRAVEAADVLDAARRGNPEVPSIAAAATFARAVLTQDTDGLVTAAALSLSSPRLLDAAELVVMIAGRLADLGEEELSATHTGRAIALYTSVGAIYDVQRLRSWLRSTGLHVPEARRNGGRDSLTRTESVVMSYLEEGRTNVEIAREMVISRRTVESHVSRILAKLGARSRSELIAARASELPGGRLAPGLDQLP
jgi:DNA-binding CsgD family transcriptional regulator